MCKFDIITYFVSEIHSEVSEDEDSLLLDLITGKRKRPLSITWYPSQQEVSTQTIENSDTSYESLNQSHVEDIDHVRLTDHVTLTDHSPFTDHITQTSHFNEPVYAWASPTWLPSQSIEWKEQKSIEWQPRLSIGWRPDIEDSDIVFQPSSLVDMCTEMIPMTIFRSLPKWLRRIDPSCVEFGPDLVYGIPYWMRQMDPSCVEYEDDRLPHWLRRIDPACVVDVPWCNLSPEESLTSTGYESEWNYDTGCPEWLSNMGMESIFEANSPLMYKNALPSHMSMGDDSAPTSRRGSLHSIPSWIWRLELEDDDVFDGLPRSRRTSLHSVASCASDVTSVVLDAPSVNDLSDSPLINTDEENLITFEDSEDESSVHAVPSWMAQIDLFNYETRQEKVMKHRYPFLDPEIALAAQVYDVEAQHPVHTEPDASQSDDTPWIGLGQSWDYFEDAEDIEETADNKTESSSTEQNRNWQLVPYEGRRLSVCDPKAALNRFGSYCQSTFTDSLVDAAIIVAAVTSAVTSAVSSAASSRRSSVARDDPDVAPVEYVSRRQPIVMSRNDKIAERCTLAKKRIVMKKNKKWLSRANLNRAALGGKGKKSRFFSAQKFSGRNGERAC